MRKLFEAARAAAAVLKNQLAAEDGGWVNLSGQDALGGTSYASAAGQQVSGESALCTSAAWDCLRKTVEVVSTLPLGLYERNRDGSYTRLENELDEVLSFSPNTGQTASQFWEGCQVQTELRGNAYAEKLFIRDRLVGLRPLLGCTALVRPDGGLRYMVTDRGKRYELPAEKVFHLRGFGSGNGLGMSTIKYGANSLGAALAADQAAGSMFQNGLQPSGVIRADQVLNAEQRGQIHEMLQAYSGSSRAGKIMLLEAGMSFDQLQFNPDDAQLLETRKFNVEDVCRWFGTPPVIIGHASAGQTMWGSGVEAILLSWRTLGINPRLARIENQVGFDLIPRERRRRWVLRFDRDAMLQMDSKARGDFLSRLATSATTTANERRRMIGLPELADGAANQLYIQGAMVPLNNAEGAD